MQIAVGSVEGSNSITEDRLSESHGIKIACKSHSLVMAYELFSLKRSSIYSAGSDSEQQVKFAFALWFSQI